MSYHIVDMSNQIPYSITSFHHYDMSFKKNTSFPLFSLIFNYVHVFVHDAHNMWTLIVRGIFHGLPWFSMCFSPFPLVFHINVPLFVLLFSLNISPRSVRLVIAGGADGGASPDASRAPRAAPARRVGGFELVEPIIIIVVWILG